jgi:hypothetical protein
MAAFLDYTLQTGSTRSVFSHGPLGEPACQEDLVGPDGSDAAFLLAT